MKLHELMLMCVNKNLTEANVMRYHNHMNEESYIQSCDKA